MKSHKRILIFAYGVIGLSVIVLIVLTYYRQHQINKYIEDNSIESPVDNPSAEAREDAAGQKTAQQNSDPDTDKPSDFQDQQDDITEISMGVTKKTFGNDTTFKPSAEEQDEDAN